MDVLDNSSTDQSNSDVRPWDMELNSFCAIMHFSQFAGWVVPFAGFVLPIVMWTTQKDKHPLIDEHGKNILNFMLSTIIYAIVFAILSLVIVGIFLLIGLFLATVICAIIGGIRASEGRVYRYPLTIRFVK